MNDPITRRKSLLTSAVVNGAVKCVLAPELTEGPYYVAGEKVRRNITEGSSRDTRNAADSIYRNAGK